jgi:tryptophan-rich sensory protein
MKKNWKIYGAWIAIAEAIGALSGLLSREGMRIYSQTVIQPTLAPPMWVFPVVWSILFALMGISAAIIWQSPESELRSKGLNLFVAQLTVNFFWSLIFFNLQAFGFAFLWLVLLWALVAWMIWTFYQVEPLAAWLQIPYLLWLTFAGYLSFSVWMLNR